MATRTISDAGGNWNATGSWVEGVVPTSADDVVATATSGNLNITAAAACRSIDMSLYTAILTHNAFTLTVGDASGGALNFSGSWTYTLAGDTSAITFASTSNNGGTGWPITWGGKVYGNTTFNGVGGKWVFQDNVSGRASTTSLGIPAGTVNFNGNVVSYGIITTTGSASRTLDMTNSTLNLSNVTGTTLEMGATPLNLVSTGSTVNVTGNVPVSIYLNTRSLSFNDFNITGSGHVYIYQSPTFTNLTRTGTANKVDNIFIQTSITVTNTLTINGNSATNRIMVAGEVLGTQRTITAANVSASNCDFRDITAAGAANWNLSAITGGSGDCGGNNGITFTDPATQYWVHGPNGTYNWDEVAQWRTSSGGATQGRVPLPQDDVVFDNNSSSVSGRSVTINMPRVGRNMSFTGVMNTFVAYQDRSVEIFGSLTLDPNLTWSIGAQTWSFYGRNTNITITSAGKVFGNAINIYAIGSTVTLLDNLATTAGNGRTLNVLYGTFDANGFNVTVNDVVSNNSNVRSIKMGSGTWTLLRNTTGDCWNTSTTTNLTFDKGTSKIVIDNQTNITQTFNGGGLVFNDIELKVGSAIVLFTGNNTFNNMIIPTGKRAKFTKGTTTTLKGDLFTPLSVPISEPTELLVNGDFASATGWNVQSGWEINGGVAIATNATNSYYIHQSLPLSQGDRILTSIEVLSCTAGAFVARSNLTSGTQRNSPGVYEEEVYLIHDSAPSYSGVMAVGTTSGSIDNVSIKKLPRLAYLDTNDGTGTFTLFKESGKISLPYCHISRMIGAGGAIWDAGENSVNGGDNTNVRFKYGYRPCR